MAGDSWTPADSVDALLDSWAARRPELDFAPVGVLTRLARLRRHLETELEAVYAAHGLDAPSFSVFVTVERLGGDGGVAPARLREELGLPGAAIDERVAVLRARGFLADDAHGRLRLSEAGQALFASLVPAHLDNGRRLLGALSGDDEAALGALLRRLLVEFEGSRPAPDAGAGLGLTVAPAHVTADLRRTVGLEPVPGLLVQRVESGSAAAGAGLRPGDVLLRAGRRELRTAGALYEALAGRRVRLTVLRGEDELTIAVDVPAGLRRAVSAGRAAYAEHRL